MVRDILNYLGDKIGELELPDSTPEEVWQERLSKFAQSPEPPANYNIRVTVEQRRKIAEDLLQEWKVRNVAGGINAGQALWLHHRLRAMSVTLPPQMGGLSFTIDLLNLVVSGDLEVAHVALAFCAPDDMSMPYHWISAERKQGWINDLAPFTGLSF